MTWWEWGIVALFVYPLFLLAIVLVIHGGKKHGDDTRWKR